MKKIFTNYKELVEFIVDDYGKTKRMFANDLGVSQNTLNSLLSGKQPGLKTTKLLNTFVKEHYGSRIEEKNNKMQLVKKQVFEKTSESQIDQYNLETFNVTSSLTKVQNYLIDQLKEKDKRIASYRKLLLKWYPHIPNELLRVKRDPDKQNKYL